MSAPSVSAHLQSLDDLEEGLEIELLFQIDDPTEPARHERKLEQAKKREASVLTAGHSVRTLRGGY